MDGPNQAMGLDVRSLLKSQSLSPSLREHIERTDVDGDGMISVDELLKVLETERTLRRERTLLIRIMIYHLASLPMRAVAPSILNPGKSL